MVASILLSTSSKHMDQALAPLCGKPLLEVMFMDGQICSDIFEAIRSMEPSSPILSLKDKEGRGILQRHLSYDMMTGPDKKIVMIPRTGFNVQFYRGQRDKDWICEPNIYRNATEESLLIDRLKTIDFTIVAEEFPPVYYARNMDVQVDMLALAQHYEMKTDMLDLTSDISVAAFFAVTKFDERIGCYTPVSDGIGCICSFFNMLGMESEDLGFRIIGLQPFSRPGQQCAFGLKLPQGTTMESLKRGRKVYFRHNRRYNQQILNIFGKEKNNALFPEELIANAAKKIRDSTYVTQRAVEQYCVEYGTIKDDLIKKLQDLRISIQDKPIFRLTKRENDALRKQFKRNPFGSIEIPIYQRLMYMP